MIDDMLSGFSSAQLLLTAPSRHDKTGGTVLGGQVAVEATATVGSIRFGSALYIYIIAALDFVIVLLMIEEAVWTKWWRGLSKFNYSDIKSVVVAVVIGKEVGGLSEPLAGTERWKADPSNKEIGKLKISMVDDEHEGPVIVVQIADPDEGGALSYRSAGTSEDHIVRAGLLTRLRQKVYNFISRVLRAKKG